MGDSEFDRATNPQPAGRQEPDGHRVDLSGGWSIGEAVNGGVIVAGMARAMALQSEGSQHNDPLVLSAFFLSGTKEAEATITTQLVRSGRSMSTVQGSLHQDLHSSDRPSHRVERVRATATFADLRLMSTSARTAARSTVQRPEFPPIEQCISPRAAPTGTGAGPPLLDRLDLRFDPATLGWAMGQPSGAGQMRAYFRLADGRENDLFTALLAVDALPPVSFDLGTQAGRRLWS